MELTVSNSNVSNAIVTDNLSINGASVAAPLYNIDVGFFQVNSSQLSINSTVVANSSSLDVLSLVLNGTAYTGGLLPFGTGGVVNTQIFTANGTWTNPYYEQSGLNGNETVFVMLWGGGGGGFGVTNGRGGGGGSCVIGNFKLSTIIDFTLPVIVGLGGGAGVAGGTSSFGNNLTSVALSAYGGAGSTGTTAGTAGGGGGLFAVGSGGNGGGPLGGTGGGSLATTSSTFGGGGAANTLFGNGGFSIFGGAGGTASTGTGGDSVYGGGGGADASLQGNSVFGGEGGSRTVAPTTPGGGGGANTATTSFFTGARGEVRVWVIK